jgi:hypothetical protein
MRITQTIFEPIRLTHAPTQGLDIAVIFHFEVDTNTAVEGRARYVDVQVLDSGFDNLCENLPCLLVVADAHLHGMTFTLLDKVLYSRG